MSGLPFGAIARDNAGRRIKILRVSVDLLLSMFQGMDGKSVLRCEGLPKDAKVVGFSTEHFCATRQLAIQVESEEFPLVVPDSHCQTFDLYFSSYDLPYDPWDKVAVENAKFLEDVIATTIKTMQPGAKVVPKVPTEPWSEPNYVFGENKKRRTLPPLDIEKKPDGNFVVKTSPPPPEAIVPLVKTCPYCGGPALEQTTERGRWQCEKNHTFRAD